MNKLWCFICISHVINFSCVDIKSPELLKAFNKTFGYIERNMEKLTPDLILGIALAEGQLSEIRNYPEPKMIQSIILRCSVIREKFSEIQTFSNNIYKSVALKITNPLLWKNKSFQLKFSVLLKQKKSIKSFDEYLDVVDKGHPTGNESDRCLAEILYSNAGFISQQCLDLMSIVEPSFGYHLTHKLLFFTIINGLNCTEILAPLNVSYMINVICSQTLLESELIEKENYPPQLLDLFMEQVLLCGFHGFTEFLKEKYVNKILTIQNKDGCFGTAETNCTNHMTGLGIGLISVILKLVEYPN